MKAVMDTMTETKHAENERQQVELMRQLAAQIDLSISAIAANTAAPFLVSVDLQHQLVQSLACETSAGSLSRSIEWQRTRRALLASAALYAAVLSQVARTARLLGQVCTVDAARPVLHAQG